jgi:multidrug efflux system outer membrane protein
MRPSHSPERPVPRARPVFLLTLVSVCSLTFPSTAVAADAVEALLRRAVEADPRLALAEAQADAAAAQVGTARARLLPRVSSAAGYTRNQVAAEVQTPAGDTITIQARDQLDANVRLDVPMIDVAGWSALGASVSCRDAGEADAVAAREQALLAVVQAAWDLRTAERAEQAARAAVEASRRVVDRAAARLDAGTGARVDALRATADLARSRGALAAAEADLAAARRALAARTGLDGLPGELAARAAPTGDLTAGVEVRAEVVAARARLACRTASASSARLGLAPTVTAFAQERFTNATGFAGQAATWSAGAQLAWTPVEGGRRAAQVTEATAQERAAAAELERVIQDARDALADAGARLDAAVTGLEAARARHEASSAAADEARARFDAGTAGAVEVSLANDESLAAAVELARAEARHALAIEALRVAAGQPLLRAEGA